MNYLQSCTHLSILPLPPPPKALLDRQPADLEKLPLRLPGSEPPLYKSLAERSNDLARSLMLLLPRDAGLTCNKAIQFVMWFKQ